MRFTMALRTDSVPRPVLAEIWRVSDGSIPKVDLSCAATTSG